MTIPYFWDGEIECGRQLGSGSYCKVLKVEDIVLLPLTDHSDEVESSRKTLDFERHNLARRFSSARGKKGKPSRQEAADLAIYGKPTKPPKEIDDPETEQSPTLALKRIREDLSTDQMRTARDDLRRETEILLQLLKPQASSDVQGTTSYHHPNIVELYGVGFDDANNGEDDNSKEDFATPFSKDLQPTFLVLGQIRSTLAKRLVKWRDERGIGIYDVLSLDTKNRRNRWVERILVISKVAHAIQHLHNHQILYRDIKPENIGYDALDVPKLFDFGLAKKLSDSMRFRNTKETSGEDPLDEGFFYLTAETGTLRYMAVEVGKGRPYGWSADVYSLAILMHEVLSLKVPFGGIAPRQFRQVIWNQGQGLVIDPSWPDPIQELLPRMWHSDPTQRPTISQVIAILDSMLRGSERSLFPGNMVSRGRLFPLFRTS